MTKNITLPSGRTATVRQGRGYDLLQAQIKAKTSEEIPYALIAELTEIDGQKLVYEDILELDLSDVIALQAELSGKFQTTAPTVGNQNRETRFRTRTGAAAVQASGIAGRGVFRRSAERGIQRQPLPSTQAELSWACQAERTVIPARQYPGKDAKKRFSRV